MMNPAPNRNPPITWAHMNVGLIHISDRSARPRPASVYRPTIATRIAVNMTLNTVMSYR